MSRIAIYLRVSTKDQKLDLQIQNVMDFINDDPALKGLPVDRYQDIASGTNDRRSGFLKLVEACKSGMYSHVVVYKLDRLSRNIKTTIRTVLDIDDNTELLSSSQPSLNRVRDYRLKIMLVVSMSFAADLERESISDRTKHSLQALMAKGIRLGRPVVSPEYKKLVLDKIKNGDSIKAICREVKISRSSVYNIINEEKTG